MILFRIWDLILVGHDDNYNKVCDCFLKSAVLIVIGLSVCPI